MSAFLVILLIAIGMALIVVEVVVLPGITLAGIAGIILIAAGVFVSFSAFGDTVGIVSLIGSSLLFIVFLIYALRAKTWNRLSLKSEIDSKVNLVDKDIQVGDTAVTLSRLAPMGKIRIHNTIVEAKSILGLIDENRTVKVLEINGNRIVVQEE
ncbi:MAG: hypothetical protein LBU62_00715 [Bacteroidales bacterium]|jgi:membrane-bound ClpP family serine protease|nr:hypothetical protein [Bacteroidales bacterium]